MPSASRTNGARLPTALLALAALAALAAPASSPAAAASAWHVAPDGHDSDAGSITHPLATIQRAVDLAAAGDIVLLADGDYIGPGNSLVDFRGKDLTVRSRSGRRANCRLFAGGGDGFVLVSGETGGALIADLTVVGAARGVVVKNSFARVVNCVLDSCAVGVDVGGPGGRLEMERSLVRRGGIGARFHYGAQGGVITGTTFRDNSGAGVVTAHLWSLAAFGALRLVACELLGNGGDGLLHQAPAGHVELVDCDVAGNGGWGVMSLASFDRGVSVTRGAVRDNLAGGINTAGSQWDFVTGSKIYGNGGPGILTAFDAIHGISECLIRDNAGDGIAIGSGPAKAAKRWQPVTIRNCEIYGNGGSGISFASGPHHDNLVAGTLIYRNTGPGIRVTTPPDPVAGTRIIVRESTLTGNGAGLMIGSAVRIELERALIAFNLGAAVDCAVAPDAVLSCSNLYGNGGGDWTGPIAGQAGAAGNFAADPRFCDQNADNYRLADLSPCLPKNRGDADNCGRVGALDIGCIAAPDIADRRAPALPALDPCQPNPFNPSTTIRLELPAPGLASLDVFDLSGRRVRALLSGHQDAGAHSVVWDGRDDAGRIVGAGTYLARLEAGGAASTTRMTLVK